MSDNKVINAARLWERERRVSRTKTRRKKKEERKGDVCALHKLALSTLSTKKASGGERLHLCLRGDSHKS